MKCGFVGVGVALLEEMCHCGGRIWGLLCSATSCDTIHFLGDQDVELLVSSPAPCLTTGDHTSHLDDNGRNL